MKRSEADIYRLRTEELEAKVSELATRLENQTAEVIRLQSELEEYEYKLHFNQSNHLEEEEDEEEEEEESEYEDFAGENDW